MYELENTVWDESSFEEMHWHDANIYGFAFLPEKFEFILDIDFILEWIHPIPPEVYFKFWVAPATLVFENVHNLRIDLEPIYSIAIDKITRDDPRKPINAEYISRDTEWKWKINTQGGEINLRSVGYKLYFRQKAILGSSQELGIEARGGISFIRSYNA
jgi:hypothetical protein